MRSRFEEQLILLNKELITMGAMCEEIISASVRTLTKNTPALSKEIADAAAQIAQKEHEIETMCLRLLLQQQPVAKDLRTISSALKMITDMKRIGDQADDIAEIAAMENITASADTLHIHDMAQATIKMVTESIDAFVKKDIAIANSVILYDDIVDEYFNQVKEALVKVFGRENADVEYALDLLMIAKYFERIGDHAVNIAEWVLFSITGKHIETEEM